MSCKHKLQQMSTEASQHGLAALEDLFDEVQNLSERDKLLIIDVMEDYLERAIILASISETA